PQRAIEDATVREAEARDDVVLFIRQVRVRGEGPGAVAANDDGEEIDQGGDGELAGDVARAMPSHAICYGHDAVLRQEEEAVLVVLSQQTSIRHPGEPGLHGERVDAELRSGASFKAPSGKRNCRGRPRDAS